jgi:hypothetical protein
MLAAPAAMRMVMMAITTSSSTRVNAGRMPFDIGRLGLGFMDDGALNVWKRSAGTWIPQDEM